MPGLEFRARPQRQLPEPLRSDVAGFIGRARRGPVGRAVRVEGWRGYLREFGGLAAKANMPYAVRAYFENGGEVAYIVRVAASKIETAHTEWDVGDQWVFADRDSTTRHTFRYRRYTIRASSAGRWGGEVLATIRYERAGSDQQPRLEMVIRAPDEPDEVIRDLTPWMTPEHERTGAGQTMASRVAGVSRLIRINPVAGTENGQPGPVGPSHHQWAPITLNVSATDDGIPDRAAYTAAIQELGDQSEVGFSVMPDLHQDLTNPDEPPSDDEGLRREMIGALCTQAASLQDRMVLIDTSPEVHVASDAMSFTDRLHRDLSDDAIRRVAAVYHPWLRVADPLGGMAQPFKTVPPGGHVAGVYSRLDRERGAHYTPANVSVFDAVDLEDSYGRDDIALFNVSGVNSLICRTGRGLTVWGGRTLDRTSRGRFVGHRRFIQRLVRSIRRVAEPLVFENNLPGLWLTLIRAVTSVLMEAWRAGALQGNRADEAFLVRCDEETNPATSRALGRVVCEIRVALAAPMEFITMHVALSESGLVEVFDS